MCQALGGGGTPPQWSALPPCGVDVEGLAIKNSILKVLKVWGGGDPYNQTE